MLDEEKYLVRSVVEDLSYLRDGWNHATDDPSVRRGSNILRRLMVQDELGRAWRDLEFHGEPTVPAWDLISTLELNGLDPKQMELAHFGGDSWTLLGPHHPDHFPPTPITRDFPLSQFRGAPCMIISGNEISRQDLILYVANTLGGVHSGAARGKPDKIAKFKSLDSIRESFGLRGRPAIYFALLAIGQALGAAPDMQVLIERARESPQPFDSLRAFRQHSNPP